MLEPMSACSVHFTSRVSYPKFQLKQKHSKLMHLQHVQMHLPVALQKCQSRKTNVLHKNHLNHVQKIVDMQNQINKVQFGSCCCRANTSCEAKQIPNNFQKHHSHRQHPKTHSKNVVLHENVLVNDIIPDMMASRSLPENTKNNDLYLVRRRDLVKTNWTAC